MAQILGKCKILGNPETKISNKSKLLLSFRLPAGLQQGTSRTCTLSLEGINASLRRYLSLQTEVQRERASPLQVTPVLAPRAWPCPGRVLPAVTRDRVLLSLLGALRCPDHVTGSAGANTLTLPASSPGARC